MAATLAEQEAGENHERSPAILLQHISVVFGGVRALDDVSFTVERGEIHCLAGENGSGKSTLIKVIAGVYRPEPGAEMHYFGKTETSMTPNAARNSGIDVIWQDLALFPEMTVAENIAFDALVGGRPRLVNHSAMRNSAEAALSKLGVRLDLDARLNTLPSHSVRLRRSLAHWSATRGSFSWTSRRRRLPNLRPIIFSTSCGRSRLTASLSSSSATASPRCSTSPGA